MNDSDVVAKYVADDAGPDAFAVEDGVLTQDGWTFDGHWVVVAFLVVSFGRMVSVG